MRILRRYHRTTTLPLFRITAIATCTLKGLINLKFVLSWNFLIFFKPKIPFKVHFSKLLFLNCILNKCSDRARKPNLTFFFFFIPMHMPLKWFQQQLNFCKRLRSVMPRLQWESTQVCRVAKFCLLYFNAQMPNNKTSLKIFFSEKLKFIRSFEKYLQLNRTTS